MICIRKIKNEHFDQNSAKGPLCVTRLKCDLPAFYLYQRSTKLLLNRASYQNVSHCPTSILSKDITSTLTAVKDHVNKYHGTVFSNSNVNAFGQ